MYSLRHMNISKLFYPSTAQALEAEAKAKMKKNGTNKIGRMCCLPKPSIYYRSYTSAVSNPYSSNSVLAVFGESKNKILCSGVAGSASIYNTELRSLTAIPKLNSPKGHNYVAISILLPMADLTLAITQTACTSWIWALPDPVVLRFFPMTMFGAGVGIHSLNHHS